MKVLKNSNNQVYSTTQNKALKLPDEVELNVKHFTFQINENTVYPLTVANNSNISEHFTDPSARILIVPNSNISEFNNTYSISMAIGLNVSADNKYQLLVRTNHTSAIYATAPISSQTESNTYLQATADGKIILFPYGSTYYFTNGEYDLYFLW